jgi:hypothetical protein
MIAVLGDHFLMDRTGAMNADAQPARRDSLYVAQITLENLHEVLPRRIGNLDTCYSSMAPLGHLD